ncbi:hypothetical protein [Clostridium rectalis]|uniref:hypothetical protein n=1 Tax=Clostridium rectalis TaxID=2040295 RepID=UPI000F64366C|nr:hypothetical protein [Clostridium rectalis]
MENKKTSELLDILNSIEDESKLTNYINEAKNTFSNLNFHSYFGDIIKKKNLKKSKLIENSNIDRTYCYQILNGTKNPSRDKILQLCISAKLNINEVQRLLTLGNVGQLYPKDARDSAIIFAINKSLTLLETDYMLSELNLTPLGDE